MSDVQIFGGCEVRRVVEWVGPIKQVDELFPDAPQHVWNENVDWVDPAFYLPDEGEHVINDRLRLELTPGHTPGSSVLWLDNGSGAVFAGDLLHSPLQVGRPDDVCSFDLDADMARASRRDILDRTPAGPFFPALSGPWSADGGRRQSTQQRHRRLGLVPAYPISARTGGRQRRCR